MSESTTESGNAAMASANVIGAVSLCGLLALLLVVLLLIWNRQRQILKKRRSAYQRHIVSRQHESLGEESSRREHEEVGPNEKNASTPRKSKVRTFTKQSKSADKQKGGMAENKDAAYSTSANLIESNLVSNMNKIHVNNKNIDRQILEPPIQFYRLDSNSKRLETSSDEGGVNGPYYYQYSMRTNHS